MPEPGEIKTFEWKNREEELKKDPEKVTLQSTLLSYENYFNELGKSPLSDEEFSRLSKEALADKEAFLQKVKDLTEAKDVQSESILAQSDQSKNQLQYEFLKGNSLKDYEDARRWAKKSVDPNSKIDDTTGLGIRDKDSKVRLRLLGFLKSLKEFDLQNKHAGKFSNEAAQANKKAEESYETGHMLYDKSLEESDLKNDYGFDTYIKEFKSNGVDLLELRDQGKIADETIGQLVGYLKAADSTEYGSEYRDYFFEQLDALLEKNKLAYQVTLDKTVRNSKDLGKLESGTLDSVLNTIIPYNYIENRHIEAETREPHGKYQGEVIAMNIKSPAQWLEALKNPSKAKSKPQDYPAALPPLPGKYDTPWFDKGDKDTHEAPPVVDNSVTINHSEENPNISIDQNILASLGEIRPEYADLLPKIVEDLQNSLEKTGEAMAIFTLHLDSKPVIFRMQKTRNGIMVNWNDGESLHRTDLKLLSFPNLRTALLSINNGNFLRVLRSRQLTNELSYTPYEKQIGTIKGIKVAYIHSVDFPTIAVDLDWGRYLISHDVRIECAPDRFGVILYQGTFEGRHFEGRAASWAELMSDFSNIRKMMEDGPEEKTPTNESTDFSFSDFNKKEDYDVFNKRIGEVISLQYNKKDNLISMFLDWGGGDIADTSANPMINIWPNKEGSISYIYNFNGIGLTQAETKVHSKEELVRDLEALKKQAEKKQKEYI